MTFAKTKRLCLHVRHYYSPEYYFVYQYRFAQADLAGLQTQMSMVDGDAGAVPTEISLLALFDGDDIAMFIGPR